MSFVVAFRMPHNEGIVTGIITGPDFDDDGHLVDLYEVDANIQSFSDREEAEAWIADIAQEAVDEGYEVDKHESEGGTIWAYSYSDF